MTRRKNPTPKELIVLRNKKFPKTFDYNSTKKVHEVNPGAEFFDHHALHVDYFKLIYKRTSKTIKVTFNKEEVEVPVFDFIRIEPHFNKPRKRKTW